MKISLNEITMIDRLVEYLADKYSENLIIHCGNVHDYLDTHRKR